LTALQRKTTGLITTISVLAVMASEASAQSAPALPPFQVPQPPQLPDDTIQSPEIEHTPLESPSIPAPTFSPEPAPIETAIVVSEFNFIGNTVFSDEQLGELARPYMNREIAFSELVQLRSEITDLYVNSGYVTSGAYLPVAENQAIDVNSATIAIEIIEGTIQEIEYSGDARLERYVRSRLEHAISPVLSQPKLEEALRLLQIDLLIENISANLSAGAQIGSSLLSVQVEAQPSFQVSFGVDNHRIPSVGTLQGTTQVNASNLLALGEVISLGYSVTDGSDGFNAGIALPINASNGTVSFDYAQLNGRIVEAPLDDFDIQTDSRVYGLSLRQPLLRQASESAIQEFAVGVSASRIESSTTLAGFPFPLSPGANENGETRVTELALFQDYTRQEEGSALRMRSRFAIALDAFDATSGPEPNGQYLTWRGQALWLQNVWGNSRLLISGDMQLSGDQLLPVSQFSLGGANSVRGYRQDAIIADNGVLVAAELAVPLLEPRQKQQLSLIPFAGTGIAWNNGAQSALAQNFLASVGLGLRYEWNDFTARVNYAVPFTEVERDGNSWQENGLDFSLNYQVRF
jgi:hemolysin activation/secretion protein